MAGGILVGVTHGNNGGARFHGLSLAPIVGVTYHNGASLAGDLPCRIGRSVIDH
jgi:hypothetical protein